MRLVPKWTLEVLNHQTTSDPGSRVDAGFCASDTKKNSHSYVARTSNIFCGLEKLQSLRDFGSPILLNNPRFKYFSISFIYTSAPLDRSRCSGHTVHLEQQPDSRESVLSSTSSMAWSSSTAPTEDWLTHRMKQVQVAFHCYSFSH